MKQVPLYKQPVQFYLVHSSQAIHEYSIHMWLIKWGHHSCHPPSNPPPPQGHVMHSTHVLSLQHFSKNYQEKMSLSKNNLNITEELRISKAAQMWRSWREYYRILTGTKLLNQFYNGVHCQNLRSVRLSMEPNSNTADQGKVTAWQ